MIPLLATEIIVEPNVRVGLGNPLSSTTGDLEFKRGSAAPTTPT
jgi:hypothetical protein